MIKVNPYWKKELEWFFIATIIPLGLYFSNRTLFNDSITANIHDTYYVFDEAMMLILTIFFSFYCIYFLRIILERLSGATGNSIYMLLNLVLIVGILFLAHHLESISANIIFSSFLEYDEDIVKTPKGISFTVPLLHNIAIILSLLELFVGYKTYRNIKPAKKSS